MELQTRSSSLRGSGPVVDSEHHCLHAPEAGYLALPYAARRLNNCCTKCKTIIVQANAQLRCYKEKNDKNSIRADVMVDTRASNLSRRVRASDVIKWQGKPNRNH